MVDTKSHYYSRAWLQYGKTSGGNGKPVTGLSFVSSQKTKFAKNIWEPVIEKPSSFYTT